MNATDIFFWILAFIASSTFTRDGFRWLRVSNQKLTLFGCFLERSCQWPCCSYCVDMLGQCMMGPYGYI